MFGANDENWYPSGEGSKSGIDANADPLGDVSINRL
jgi:hypothetical protein